MWSYNCFAGRGPTNGRIMVKYSLVRKVGSVLQESLKFGVLKLSRVPEIRKIEHRQGEYRVLTETRETRVISALLWGLTEEWRHKFSAPGIERRVLPYSSHPSVLKAFREQVESRAAYTKPAFLCTGGAFPLGQVHLRISTTGPSPRRPAQTTHSHQVY